MTLNRKLTITAIVLGLMLAALCAFAQVPPLPVATPDAGPSILTNHVCPARLPVGFLSWTAPTNWTPKAYRVYATTNPATPFTNYEFYAEVPRTSLAVIMLGKSQEFFCVSAVSADGRESVRATK